MKFGKVIKTFKSKNGKAVVIRTLKPGDLNDLLAFANNLIAEDTFVMLSGDKITKKEEQKYLKDSLEKMKNGQKIHLVVFVNGEFAGSSDVRRLERRKSHVGEVGISLGRNFREEGIGSVLLETLISEARKLGLGLLIIHCFENNDRALHVYEKLGFRRAGTVPGMYNYQGKFIGEVTFYLPL